MSRGLDPAARGAGQTLLLARIALVAAMAAIAWFAFTPVPPAGIERVWDKLQHASAFLVLSALLDRALPRCGVWPMALIAFGYGAMIEAVQSLLPWRDASLRDLLADLLGIGIYFIILRPLVSALRGGHS